MQKDKDDIVLPTNDLFIASLWSPPKNEPLLRSLLNCVLTDSGEPPIVQATVLNPVNILEYPADKQIRLDVLVKDETDAMYDIEVQTAPHVSFVNRILRYWSETYNSQLERGDEYKKQHPVRGVVITIFPIFRRLNNLHSVFEICARENPAVKLTDHFQLHFLRLGDMRNNPAGLDKLNTDLRNWMTFLAYGFEYERDKMNAMLMESPLVKEAYEEYKKFSATPELRHLAAERRRFLVDYEEGMTESREEGKAEGLAEGEAKGKNERSAEVARNLRRMGIKLEDISIATGLSISDVEKL
ncbi:hypothetical protein FACS18942_09920 [Planctomycetales bacterium]|nr:hypothetical protein FACS18942_09920 [Planctomycetales bacterium]